MQVTPDGFTARLRLKCPRCGRVNEFDLAKCLDFADWVNFPEKTRCGHCGNFIDWGTERASRHSRFWVVLIVILAILAVSLAGVFLYFMTAKS